MSSPTQELSCASSPEAVIAIRRAVYAFCHRLAFQVLGPKTSKPALKLLLEPLNYWRNLEVPAVIHELDLRPADTVLDISSPKIASLFICHRYKCRTYSTDLYDYFWPEYSVYLRGLRSPATRDNFIMEVQDARRLTYDAEYFDRVYSISVLEHITDDGDTRAMQEINRVLRKGGICCVTVPYAAEYRETYTTQPSYYIKIRDGQPAFYQRHYDRQALWDRLLTPSGLEVLKLQYFGEPLVPYERFYDALPYALKIGLAPFSRLATRLFIAPVTRTYVRHSMTAILTLRK